jgi:hypothetical protein
MDFKETKKELADFAKYVIQQARSNLTKEGKSNTGALYKSLDYEIDIEKGAILVDFIMEDYGEFVDQGVKGKNPNSLPQGAKWSGIQKAPNSPFKFGKNKSKGLRAAINRWTIQKGLKGVRDAKGRFIGRKSLQYLITRSIYLSGLKTTLFFTKPFNKGLQRFTDKFLDAFALDIENGIILGTKK